MYRLSAAAVAVLIILGWLWVDFQRYADGSLQLQQPVVFEIAKGERFPSVVAGLSERGVVSRPLWFEWLAVIEGTHKRFKYGEYEIAPTMTPRGLLQMLAAGKVRHYAVTLVEGWTFDEALAGLAKHSELMPATAGKSPKQIMAMLGDPEPAPEGLFFPDTYYVTKGATDLDVLKRARAKMRTVLEEEWRGRWSALPLETSYHALILASIVEKETARGEERAKVAGVFVRRLSRGMRLQTDPTVIYGMGSLYMGNIRKADLLRDTPYNTYTRAGLPPTPIALPGRSSIHAVMHPDNGGTLYFVARGDGTHEFSDTLQQHQDAVKKFQRH